MSPKQLLSTLFPSHRDHLVISGVLPGGHTVIEGDVHPSHATSRRLLGALVAQARHDGMGALRVGVGSSGESFLRYYGPSSAPSAQWHDMTSPLADWYPYLFQAIIGLAVLDPGIPLKGWVPGIQSHRQIDLRLVVNEVNSFELSWGLDKGSEAI